MRQNKEERPEMVRDINLKESLVLLYFLSNDNRPAYAAQIERELPKSSIYVGWPEGGKTATITRRWAKKICEQLEEAGIMESILRRTRRQKNLSKYYYLRSDLESFKWIFRRVSIFFGGFLVSSKYAQDMIEEQLISDLEKKYDTEFDEEVRTNVIVTLFLSPRAVELALGDLVLPSTEHPRDSKLGRKEVNETLLAIFQSALVTDIVRSGLAWRRERIDEIDFTIETKLRKGDVEASISSRMRFETDVEQDILTELRVEKT